MALDTHKVLKLLTGSVLFGLLSGCMLITSGIAAAPLGHPSSELWIICTTEDSIAVRYGNTWGNYQHDEAMQIITEHCDGGYIETKEVKYWSSRHVYATCLQADGSPEDSQPCGYDADENAGFGQEDVTTPDG